ncbi:MAG: 50S ribosomal protein L25/general stress protein Ctc [Gammaproteobacteria bacterium]|nr:50S ribosomal protein L25/general stress protein Ctc [Gammaproteobacteria bacterium]
MSDFVLNAELRNDMGKGASRRLRSAGKVPAILYGGHKDPTSITLTHNELAHQVANEAFFSHILTINLDGKEENAIVKDLQRHPSKPIIMHIDLQRVSATENIRVHVPLHFINEATSPGVKGGGLVAHSVIEVEVQCLPKNLPEFIEVDLGNLELNQIIHLSDLKLPAGVELVELSHGESHDQAVASIHLPRAAKEAEETGGGETPPPAAPAAGE